MVRWGWWLVKFYKIINSLGYKNMCLLYLNENKSDIYMIKIFDFIG